MTPSDYVSALQHKAALDRLLDLAASERDANKFRALLQKINRLRAERWLVSGQCRPGVPVSIMAKDTFEIFSGAPDKDAAWLATVVGLDEAREHIRLLWATAPGEYFALHSRSQMVLNHLTSESMLATSKAVA